MTDRLATLPPRERQSLRTISLLSPKWHPVVMLTLGRHEPIGFNALLNQIPPISSKSLSSTLEQLDEDGLIERSVVSESPLRVEYALTEAGNDLLPALDRLGEWGEDHLEVELPCVLLAAVDRRLTEMYATWLTDSYDVRRAHDIDEFVRTFSDTIDVLVLDERFSMVTGVEESLEETVSCRSVLVVGDRPDIELFSMPWDDVLRKPLVQETLQETVDNQLRRMGEPTPDRRFASIEAKQQVLETIYPENVLEHAEAYQDMFATLTELQDT